MARFNNGTATIKHTCLRCERIWYSDIEHPQECTNCRSRSWDKPYASDKVIASRKLESMVLKPVDHTEHKPLPFIGAKCPYCRGTTGLDTFRIVAFCYSCDMTFSLTSGKPLGVLQGIGLR